MTCTISKQNIYNTFVGLVLSLLFARNLDAATVKKVNIKKGTVTIDVSGDETIEVDNSICFFNENDKKIDCGIVTKVGKKNATVKLKSKKKMKRIKPDMSARPEDAAESGDSSSESSAGKMPMGIQGRYIYSIAAPYAYNKLGYLVPTSTTPETLWKSEGTVSSSLLGLSLAFSIPISKFAIIPGFRYRSSGSAEVLSDYATDRANPYISSATSGQSLGIFADFQFMRSQLGKIAFLNLASGLDIDSSTVTFLAKKKDDTGATPESELGKVTSKLTVISLRLCSSIDLMFGKSFGFASGLNLLIPLAGAGAQFSGQLATSEAKGIADPAADLKKAVDHKKSSFGAEFHLGPSYNF